MATKNAILSLTLDFVDSATLNAVTFTQFATGVVPESAFSLRFTNDSNLGYEISFDGTNPHEFIVSGDAVSLNPTLTCKEAFFKKGITISARGVAGVGFLTASGFYLDKGER